MTATYTRTESGEHLALSFDDGRTFREFEGNPVVEHDGRDPNVFWYEPGQKWVMVVALPTDYKVQFYESDTLTEWTFMSEFGPAGATSGIWECPDLSQREIPVRERGGESTFRHLRVVSYHKTAQGVPSRIQDSV